MQSFCCRNLSESGSVDNLLLHFSPENFAAGLFSGFRCMSEINWVHGMQYLTQPFSLLWLLLAVSRPKYWYIQTGRPSIPYFKVIFQNSFFCCQNERKAQSTNQCFTKPQNNETFNRS